MEIALSVISLLVIVSAILFNQTASSKVMGVNDNSQPLVSVNPTLSPSPTVSFSPKPTRDSVVEVKKILLPSPTTNLVSGLTDFIYPASKVIESKAAYLKLSSSGDVHQITKWYEAKINSQGFNAQSFSETQVNSLFQNELVGAKDNLNLRVSIQKKEGEKEVSIEVFSQAT